jgi:hypothetical protein
MAPATLVVAGAVVRRAAVGNAAVALHAAAPHAAGPEDSRVGDRGLARDRRVMARATSARHPSAIDRSAPASVAGRDRPAIARPVPDRAAASEVTPARVRGVALVREVARGRERDRGPAPDSDFVVSRDRRMTPRPTRLGSTIGRPGSRAMARDRPPRAPGFPRMVPADPADSVREAPVRATSGPGSSDRPRSGPPSSSLERSSPASSRPRSSREPPPLRSSSRARS